MSHEREGKPGYQHRADERTETTTKLGSEGQCDLLYSFRQELHLLGKELKGNEGALDLKQPEVSTGFAVCQWTIVTNPSRKSLCHELTG